MGDRLFFVITVCLLFLPAYNTRRIKANILESYALIQMQYYLDSARSTRMESIYATTG